MTIRYGELFASFWEWDDPTYTVISTGPPSPLTFLEAESAEILRKLGQIDRGRFVAPLQDDWQHFLVEGRICSLYQYDGVLGTHRDMGAFLMEKVTPRTGPDGRTRIEVSGQGREKLLTRYRHFDPVGAETLYVTTVAANAPAPWSTTVATGAPAGNDHVVVADMGNAKTGDKIRIQMETGDWFIGSIVDIEPPATPANSVVFEPRLPYASFAGRPVEFRRGRLQVADMTGMAAGLEIQVLLDSLAVHQTLIADISPETSAVILRDGMPSASSIGKQVTAYDYSQPATDDVTQIMAPATGWELAFDGAWTGTADGTTHQPEGESVWDLLVATAERSGEFFRAAALAAGHTPRKKLEWHRNHDSSGMTLALYATNFEVSTATENANLAVIHQIEREREHNVITRVYPLGADGRISLSYATTTALAAATAAGFAVGKGAGLRGRDYVEYTPGVTAHGVLSDVVRYGNLTLSEKGAVSELQAAADSMLSQAMATILDSQQREYWRVKAHMHRPLYPGQTVALVNAAMAPETEGATTMYVLEVREVLERGVIMTHLLLSKEDRQRPTAAMALGKQLLSTKQAALRPSTAGAMVVGAVIPPGGGGGATDHGALTGLGDDDHPQYLRADGTRALSGNLAVGAGVTVDGVDISGHAADPDAHHARVTAGNTAIGLAGQAVSVALKVNHPGLVVSAGLGLGLPGTLGAATSDAVSGESHTHAVAASDNTVAAIAPALLKSDATGGLALDRLGVGVAADTAAALKVQARAVDDYSLWLKQLTGQVADMWRVEDKDGNALIRLTGGGDLESGKPGFVSGQTGWQIAARGNAEFNDVRVRGELHAATFVADEMHAVGGTLLVKTAGRVGKPVGGSDNVMGNINANFTLRAEASWDAGLNYFPVGSILRIKPMGEIAGGGSLDLYDIYLQVISAGSVTGRNLAAGEPGTFALTVARRHGGAANFVIPTGAAIVKWSEVGASGYTGAVSITADGDVDSATEAPHIDVFTVGKKASGSWGGILPVIIPRARFGNLRGVMGKSADEWGVAMSTDLSSTAVTTPSAVISDLGLALRNVDLKMYSGANPTVELSAGGALKLGTDVGADATTTFSFDAATGGLRVGPLVNGKPHLLWDGTALSLMQRAGGVSTPVLTLDSSGASYFAGPMALGANGGIWQGTGGSPSSFANPYNGLKIWNESSAGRLALFSGGAQRVTLRHDRGLELSNNLGESSSAAITFTDVAGGTTIGGLFAYKSGSFQVAKFYQKFSPTAQAGVRIATDSVRTDVRLYSGNGDSESDTILELSSSYGYVSVRNGDLYVLNKGVAIGYPTYIPLNRGQMALDLGGEHDFNTLVLQDSGKIDHGITDIVATNTYGALGKNNNDEGGLLIRGLNESVVGVNIAGYGALASSSTTTSSNAAVQVSAFKKSGTGTGNYADNENIFAIRNNLTTQVIVKGDGQVHLNTTLTQNSYDDEDDVALLRTADLALSDRLDRDYEAWLNYNRDDLTRLDLVTFNDDGSRFVNLSKMQRLLTGAIWQIHERLSRLEGNYG